DEQFALQPQEGTRHRRGVAFGDDAGLDRGGHLRAGNTEDGDDLVDVSRGVDDSRGFRDPPAVQPPGRAVVACARVDPHVSSMAATSDRYPRRGGERGTCEV